MPLGIEGGGDDIRDGPHWIVRLLPFQRSTKFVDADVAVIVERAGTIGNGISVGDAQPIGRSDQLGEDRAR